jgi:hypothetical protein
MDSSVSPKTKSSFCGCVITLQTQSTTSFNTPTQKFALHYILRECRPVCKITARFKVNVLTVEVLREEYHDLNWTDMITITSNRRNHMNTAMNLPPSQKVQQVWCTPLCISNTKPKVPFHSAHTTCISKQIRFCLRYMCRLLHFKMVESNIDFKYKTRNMEIVPYRKSSLFTNKRYVDWVKKKKKNFHYILGSLLTCTTTLLGFSRKTAIRSHF